MFNLREETENYLKNSFRSNPPIQKEEFFKIIDNCKKEFDSFMDKNENQELTFAIASVLEDYFADMKSFVVDDVMPQVRVESISNYLVH